MKLIRLCWSEEARKKKRVRESATHWYKCTDQTTRDFHANCEAGNRDFGADSHWVELWEVVESQQDGDPSGDADPP